jgi:hypothetical protein
MVPILLVATLVFVLYSRWLFKSMKSFYSPREAFGKWLVFLSKGIFTCLCAPHFFHSWKDSLTIRFRWCLILGKTSEYNHTTKALQPMTPIIFSKDIVVALHQLQPPPSNLVLPPIFYYQPKHTFVLDRIMFGQALAITPHLFSNGLSKM